MNKEDYIALIEVAEAEIVLDKICKFLTDTTLSGQKVEKIKQVWAVLRRNGNKKFHDTSDLQECSRRFHDFYKIVADNDISTEEKYVLLMAD